MNTPLEDDPSALFAPPFNRRRAVLGVAVAVFFLVTANLSATFEPGELPHTNFDPGWVMCNTIAYGWPLGVLRVAADAHCPRGALPDVESIWLCVDFGFAAAICMAFGLIAGGIRAGFRELLGPGPHRRK